MDIWMKLTGMKIFIGSILFLLFDLICTETLTAKAKRSDRWELKITIVVLSKLLEFRADLLLSQF